MSLLNDALRDLEQRGGDASQPQVPPGLRGGGARGRTSGGKGKYLVIGLLAVAVVAVAVWLGVRYWNASDQPVAQREPLIIEPKPQPKPEPVASASAAEQSVVQSPAQQPEPVAEVEAVAEPAQVEPVTTAAESKPVDPKPQPIAATEAPATKKAETHTTSTSPAAAPAQTQPVAQAHTPAQPKTQAPAAAKAASESNEIERAPVSPAARDAALARELEQHLAQGQVAAAEQQLQAAGADRALPRSRAVMARYLLQRGAYEQAERWLPERWAREYAELRLLRSRLALARGQTDQAIQWLAMELPEAAEYPGYLATLAALYQRAGEYADAGALWAALLEQNDEVADWWAGLGIALDAQGRNQAARSAYTQALNLPGLRPALNQYAQQRLTALSQ
ncbi:hypothetical protein QQM79_17805 [Marinobacteraceae bacterium S3BR75-40.1]